jgi:quercetin dioxygenase-like cupin family protein
MELERIPWDGDGAPDESELSRRLADDGFACFAWSDGPGAEYAPHSHDHDESLWLLRGRMRFGAEGREFDLGPGDRLMLPAGTVHTAVAGSDGATYLIGRR